MATHWWLKRCLSWLDSQHQPPPPAPAFSMCISSTSPQTQSHHHKQEVCYIHKCLPTKKSHYTQTNLFFAACKPPRKYRNKCEWQEWTIGRSAFFPVVEIMRRKPPRKCWVRVSVDVCEFYAMLRRVCVSVFDRKIAIDLLFIYLGWFVCTIYMFLEFVMRLC